MAQIHLTIGPVHFQTHLGVIFPISECVIKIDTLRNGQNPHSGSLTQRLQAIMVGKTK